MNRQKKIAAAAVLAATAAGILFLQFILPCRDIACFERHDRWLSSRMEPGLPLFITADNAQSLLTFIHDDKERNAVMTMLERLDKTASEKELGLKNAHPITCAVVGNSDNLLGSHYGSLIDAHSYVFRMNNAPMESYSDDVGSRITYHAIHSGWSYIKNYTPNTIHVLYIDNLGDDAYNLKAFAAYEESVALGLVTLAKQLVPDTFITSEPIPQKHFPTNVASLTGPLRIVHPNFIRSLNDHWFLPSKRSYLQWPSTGFRTFMLALYMCDKVDLFGFGKADPATGKWAHYYGAPEKNTLGHRPDYQEELIDTLAEKGIVTRYRGNEKP
jgi:hypothetical protein